MSHSLAIDHQGTHYVSEWPENKVALRMAPGVMQGREQRGYRLRGTDNVFSRISRTMRILRKTLNTD